MRKPCFIRSVRVKLGVSIDQTGQIIVRSMPPRTNEVILYIIGPLKHTLKCLSKFRTIKSGVTAETQLLMHVLAPSPDGSLT